MRRTLDLRPLGARLLALLEGGPLARAHARRWGRLAEFQGWLAQDVLPSLTPQQALALYRASGGRQAGRFRGSPIAEVRDALDFLLYDPLKLEGRFEEVAAEHGGYYLPGAGKEFASYVLCVKDPALFGVWSAAAERGLRALGLLPRPLREGPLGVRYVDFLDLLWQARALAGLADFPQVDTLLGAVAAHQLPLET